MDSGDGGGREEERKNRKKRGETQRDERERESVTDTTARHLLLGLLLVASVDRQTSPPANITSAKVTIIACSFNNTNMGCSQSNQNSSQIPSELKAAAGESINAELSTAQAWQVYEHTIKFTACKVTSLCLHCYRYSMSWKTLMRQKH